MDAGMLALLAELQSGGHMGGAGTIPGPQDYSYGADSYADPLAGNSDLLSMALSLAQQQGGVNVDGTGPLRTVNGVTMVAPAIRSLRQAKQQLGLPVFGNVVSSYRTRAEQARLYQEYLNGTGNLAAKPGTSNHETGNAVDISSAYLASHPELVQWLSAHGWENNVGGEPWHWTYGA